MRVPKRQARSSVAPRTCAWLVICGLLLGAAHAHEPKPPEPLSQSLLVAGFLTTFQLPEELVASVEQSHRESAAATLLRAPDIRLHERAGLGPEGTAVTLAGSLDLPLVVPSLSHDRALARTGAAMTRADVLEERAWGLRAFLELLVHLEHVDDSLVMMHRAVVTVRRVRPDWLSQTRAAGAVPIDELAAATDARLAMADLLELERRAHDLRRRIAVASGNPAALTRPIARDLPLFDDPGHARDPWTDEVDACAQASSAAVRARLTAQLRNLAQARELADSLPALWLRLDGNVELSSSATPVSGGVRVALDVRIPAWQPLTGALNLGVSPQGASQELSLGWPNRYRDRAPVARLEPEAQAHAAAVEIRRNLLDTVATLADLRFRHAAFAELDRRVGPLLRSQSGADTLHAIDAAHQLTVARSQRLDIEASIRLYRLDLAYVCRRGPFASFAAVAH